MWGFNKETESSLLQTDANISGFIEGFMTAINHSNRTGKACGDLSPQREFSGYLQKQRDDQEFQDYSGSTISPVESSEEDLIRWFFH